VIDSKRYCGDTPNAFCIFICEEVFMMKNKTYLWIASILFVLSFLSAYSSDHHQKAESVHVEIQSADSATGVNSGMLMAEK
jgi:hypothetical protein